MNGAPLKPLKSKSAPTVSASSCIHPKGQLRGGGNGTSSYVVCRACHSRWALEGRAADIRKQLHEARPLEHEDGESAPSSRLCKFRPNDSCEEWRTHHGSSASNAKHPDENSGSHPGGLAITSGLRAKLARDEGEPPARNGYEQPDHPAAAQERAGGLHDQISQASYTQVNHLVEEMRKTANASREQELRPEKLLQMLVQLQQEQHPGAGSQHSPPRPPQCPASCPRWSHPSRSPTRSSRNASARTSRISFPCEGCPPSSPPTSPPVSGVCATSSLTANLVAS